MGEGDSLYKQVPLVVLHNSFLKILVFFKMSLTDQMKIARNTDIAVIRMTLSTFWIVFKCQLDFSYITSVSLFITLLIHELLF